MVFIGLASIIQTTQILLKLEKVKHERGIGSVVDLAKIKDGDPVQGVG